MSLKECKRDSLAIISAPNKPSLGRGCKIFLIHQEAEWYIGEFFVHFHLFPFL